MPVTGPGCLVQGFSGGAPFQDQTMNIRTLCLGILRFGDATGYEIKKMVEEDMFNHFIEASYGSIYPALTRMSQDGLVTCREEAQSGKPDKKVYSITEEGQAELVRTLAEAPRPDKFKSEFLFVMLLGDLLPQDHIAAVYAQRIIDMRAELEQMRSCVDANPHDGSRFVTGYGIAVYEAAIAYLERHRDDMTAPDLGPAERLTETAGAAE